LRQQRLAEALELLDNALISTVHSFADRLLRLRPIDAKLSPAYEIAEDASALIEETYAGLLAKAAKNSDAEHRAWPEVKDTIRTFQAAGLMTRTISDEWYDRLGLDAFVHDLIETRDREVLIPAYQAAPNFEAVRGHVDELSQLIQALTSASHGSRRLRRLLGLAKRLARTTEVSEALRLATLWSKDLDKLGKELKKGEHFPDDSEGWDVRRWLVEGVRGKGASKEERPGGPLGKAVIRPLVEHIGNRLVRMRGLVLDDYRDLKRDHGVVDHLDLLIQLRDLLQTDIAARSFYQDKLDHILVDEFQDTDPLQAEIVMYLCEVSASATAARDVELKAGKLTIVGDPKQSIYRFRRADISTYAMVCEKLRQNDVCEARLRVNFRSASTIIHWLNDAFDAVLGSETDGPLFDAEEGTVRNVRLLASGRDQPDAEVHILPFGNADLKAEESRDLEGEALAHYIRYLVEDSELQIGDARSQERRRPRYGDIAIVMIATQTVHHLTTELDRIGVPHVVRGGTLFMEDPLHQQFILGLRAISDPSDGVARAALRRPPFFAVTLADLVLARVSDTQSEALTSTERHIERLRRERHQTTPGEHARLVLESTGFGRYVAASVNGAQRLARLYELCMALDDLARTSHLDFDGTTAVARTWLDTSPRIEAPLPIDADAVQVITAHQAKGLEWPIVALWDGRAGWKAFLPQTAFTVEALTGKWALKLEGLDHDPSDRALREREMQLREAERKRVAYVAATRARNVFIVPEAGPASERTIAGTMIVNASKQAHRRVAPYKRESSQGAWWTSQTAVSMRPLAPIRADLQEAWQRAATRALTPQLRPAAVSSMAHLLGEDERELSPLPRKPGRFGPSFGTAVHRAVELVLSRGLTTQEAATRAAKELAVEPLRDMLVEDVTRARTALERAGLLQHAFQVEYPLAGSVAGETLVSGFIDLLVDTPDGLCVIDFKTDAAPRGDVREEYPGYVEQVRSYAELLHRSRAFASNVARAGLLFTADGSLRWV
jgi:ATP-dependent helicase/nuclease subunit A